MTVLTNESESREGADQSGPGREIFLSDSDYEAVVELWSCGPPAPWLICRDNPSQSGLLSEYRLQTSTPLSYQPATIPPQTFSIMSRSSHTSAKLSLSTIQFLTLSLHSLLRMIQFIWSCKEIFQTQGGLHRSTKFQTFYTFLI